MAMSDRASPPRPGRQAARDDSLVELRGVDNPDDAALEHIWIAGIPLGQILVNLQADVKGLGDEYDRAIREELAAVREEAQDAGDPPLSGKELGKVQRIEKLVKHAFKDGTGGRAGVIIRTPEAKAVTGQSAKTTLSYMNEIGAAFDWAETKTPGGAKPKQLRIETEYHALDDVLEDVRSHFNGVGSP